MKFESLRDPLLWAWLFALLGAGSTFGQPVPAIVRGPYLQSATTSNIIVRWRTDVPTESRVHFGTVASNLNLQAVDPAPVTEHALTLSGLAPDTKYFYSILAAPFLSVGGPSYAFTTPPSGSKPTRIWAIGDVGTASLGSGAPLLVRDAYASHTGSRPTDVWLMLGDNAYRSGTDAEYQAAVFDVFQDLLRTTPLWPTLGNHETYSATPDGHMAYDDIFNLPMDGSAGGLPSGSERYYSFDYGNIHFLSLDSELAARTSASPMLTWLEQDLAATDKDWIIAYWHSPPYSKGSHDSDFESNLVGMRQQVVPILEAYGVDLVLCGHSHSYERSFLLNGHYGNSATLTPAMVLDAGSGRSEETGAYGKSTDGQEAGRGAVYVVAGSAGQTGFGLFNHPAIFISRNNLGSLIIDIEGSRLDAKFLRENGQIDDHFTILKGDQPPSIVTAPRNRTTVEGATVSFSVVAAGTRPLSYQWLFNGNPLADETNTVLTLSNVSAAEAGEYSVVVSNRLDRVTSSAAVLTVNPAPTCATPPLDLACWWPLDGDVLDVMNAGLGVLIGSPSFAAAHVGQGVDFDGADDAIRVSASPAVDVGDAPGLTIEMWMNPREVTAPMALLEWSGLDGSQLGLHFHTSTLGAGTLFANLIDTGNAPHHIASAAGLLSAGEFQHVALTYDRASGIAKMFHNGTQVAQASFGNLRLETRAGLWVGKRVVGANGYYHFQGILDEISLYDRALSQSELQEIFDADITGKCKTPFPPRIVTQPVSRTDLAGADASFSVLAVGTPPLTYQWFFAGQPLDGATNAAFLIPAVGTNDAGDYVVIVQNQIGLVTSVVATLTVNLPPPCFQPPVGLVGWWPFEHSGENFAGSGAAMFAGDPVFVPGEVSDALWLDGVNDTAAVQASPQLHVGAADGFTIESWIKPATLGLQALVEWNNRAGSVGAHLYLSQPPPAGGGDGSLFGNLVDVNGTSHWINSAGGLVSAGVWHHVALTYSKSAGVGTIYVNGVSVVQQVLGSFSVQTAPPFDLLFGHRVDGSALHYRFSGGMDEMSVYARTLSASEIQAIFAAGAAGKCRSGFAPQILVGPESQTVIESSTVTFSVEAAGTAPLAYQWLFNGGPIGGATNSTLELNNVRFGQSGDYSVEVSNGVGTVASSNAVLVVTLPPATVRVVSGVGAGGTEVLVPVELLANGTENALGFSLNFNPGVLGYVGASLGAGAPSGAALLINANDVAAGRLGLAVGLPANEVFDGGTQQVVLVTFLAAPILNQTTVPVGFGDQPTLRQLSDVQARVLPAVFVDGSFSITDSQFEGDAAPRPNGDRFVATIDWVQMGRFVARLDAISSSNEFQRADCAPRASKGNGLLTASDWVQAGRYAVGLDPLTVLGGPTQESSGEGGGLAAASASGRQLCLVNTSIAQGQTNTVPVTLECQGNENAATFSVTFDTAKLTFVTATPGSGSAGGQLNLNTSEAAQGRLGVAMAAQPGTTFAPGTREILKLRFTALATAPATTTLGFGNAPVPREVSDAAANPLATEYTVGTVSVTPPPGPPLRVTRTGNSLFITWPSSATGFELEGTAGALGTAWSAVPGVIDLGEQKMAIVTIGAGERYFRLKKP